MRDWRRKPRPDDPPNLPGYDFEQLEIKAATKRGKTLLEWRQQPEDDRARMMAFDLKEETVESYRQEWAEDMAERKKRDGERGGHGNREFRAMRRTKDL